MRANIFLLLTVIYSAQLKNGIATNYFHVSVTI